MPRTLRSSSPQAVHSPSTIVTPPAEPAVSCTFLENQDEPPKIEISIRLGAASRKRLVEESKVLRVPLAVRCSSCAPNDPRRCTFTDANEWTAHSSVSIKRRLTCEAERSKETGSPVVQSVHIVFRQLAANDLVAQQRHNV